jgi:SAM-dependent methyltransferase
MTTDLNNIREKLNTYFTEKLAKHGATAKGMDYNGETAQQVRFAELVKIIRNPAEHFSVLDYGCGYGALFDFLHTKGWQFDYYGVDRIEKMIIAGKETHKDFPNAHFTTDEKELEPVDYLIAGSIFNNKLEVPNADWQDFVVETLHGMNALCVKGFSFNMLTSYSDEDRMSQRPDLFFGDPLFFFDVCKRNFSRNVAILHDYGLYDFTILVRKDI